MGILQDTYHAYTAKYDRRFSKVVYLWFWNVHLCAKIEIHYQVLGQLYGIHLQPAPKLCPRYSRTLKILIYVAIKV